MTAKTSGFEDKENSLSAVRRRSSDAFFQFSTHCLYCGAHAEVGQDKGELVRLISKPTSAKSILKRADQRNDDWAITIKGRINSVHCIKAEKARYHDDCQTKFYLSESATVAPRGRPKDMEKRNVFEELCSELESNDECQFSLSELSAKLNSEEGSEKSYDIKYLKVLLKSKYQNKAHITELAGRNGVFCFKGTADQFVYDDWHASRKTDKTDDRTRVLKAAAKILTEDIRSKAIDMNNYFCGGEMNEEDLVPESLMTFISSLIPLSSNQANRSKVAIAQAIMQACRPRSFISPILLAVGVYIHRHTANKSLIDLLHNLGLSASYSEVQTFLLSAVAAGAPEKPSLINDYMQFAFDNADYNVKTLDGHGTFHNMGGIKISTPGDVSPLPYTIPRLKNKSGFRDLNTGRIPVKQYFYPSDGLRDVDIRDVRTVTQPQSWQAGLRLDFFWMASYKAKLNFTPSWNGFMQEAMSTSSSFYDVSSVHPVPFINLDPGNKSCIYTALDFAYNQCKKQGQRSCVVTFDQALYQKAIEIVAACRKRGEMSGVTVRLGGFHLMISFMGSIGYIMSGSGIGELWETVYASNTVVHMISGHAFSRAIRAHMLSQLALALNIFKLSSLDLESVEREIGELHSSLLNHQISADDACASELLEKVYTAVMDTITKISENNRTARLWLSYFTMVNILRLFVRAERTSDWELHLECVRAMLPYFHAAGHLNYAKSGHHYVQSMEDLEKNMDPMEYEMYTSRGYFVIRRMQRFWSGISIDLTIEQELMRAIKCEGGLTRGRGITESTLSKWIDAVPHCVPMCNSLERFCSVRGCKSEQHVEMRDSRQKRDLLDLGKFLSWLDDHQPFQDRPFDQLTSLSTGLIADHTVNCDDALKQGEECMKLMTGKNFAEIKLQRSKRVKPLSAMPSTVRIHNEEIVMNPMQLLNRIICIQDRLESPLSDFLAYELAPRPLSLFDGDSLRKTAKSVLEKALQRISPCVTVADVVPKQFVVDGGHLLHAVVWPRPAKYSDVCQAYVEYLSRRYRPALTTVVFDGYQGYSTKQLEQMRRAAKKTSADLNVECEISVTVPKENFLGNNNNKTSLIQLLSSVLEDSGFTVRQAKGDADTVIVRTALELAENNHVSVVATDTDVLALLVGLRSPTASVSMILPGTGGTQDRVHNISTLQEKLGKNARLLLFAHAVSGCDTTSALFGKGKCTALNLVLSNPDLAKKIEIFNKRGALKEEVAAAGENFILAMYNGSKCSSLDEFRVLQYKRTVGRQTLDDSFDFRALPPTSDAARQHSYRVYLQVQEWLGNPLTATDWGWEVRGSCLVPVPATQPPAPDCLMRMVRCACRKGCERNCECRRVGVPCTQMCSHCSGEDCANSRLQIISDSDDADDPDVLT